MKKILLAGMPCALTHAAHDLEKLVTEMALTGEFSASSLELLSRDQSGRLFHTWAAQEVEPVEGATYGKYLIGFRAKNDPVVYWTIRDGII
jgi:hypothetical protein